MILKKIEFLALATEFFNYDSFIPAIIYTRFYFAIFCKILMSTPNKYVRHLGQVYVVVTEERVNVSSEVTFLFVFPQKLLRLAFVVKIYKINKAVYNFQ